MKIFDENKEKQISPDIVDLSKFKFETFKCLVKHHDAVAFSPAKFHDELIREYPNGSREFKTIIDQEAVEAKDAWDEYEDALYIVPLTDDEIKNNLRYRREKECFQVIDRSQLWYDTLTEDQLKELKEWYNEWLNVTTTMKVPDKPEWLD